MRDTQALPSSPTVLALAAVLGPVVSLLDGLREGSHGLWNDFASYWLAGKLVAGGTHPTT